MPEALLDDFFIRALLAGIGVALIAGPLGCFVVWQRLAYFGDSLAHATLLGATLALLFDGPLLLGFLAVSVVMALLLVWLERRLPVSGDALLGILSPSALALGLLALALLAQPSTSLMGLLLGDILSVSKGDLALIFTTALVVGALLIGFWQNLVLLSVSADLARAERMGPRRLKLLLMLMLATLVAVAIKILGILLITALLIIPAVAARRFAATPALMAASASLLGLLSVASGLFASLRFDLPSGPAIVVAALVIFVLSLLLPGR